MNSLIVDIAGEGERMWAQMINGIPYPPFCVEKTINSLREKYWHVAPGDVLISTYPKCGTTWMQQVALSLLAGVKCGELIDEPMVQAPWYERIVSQGDFPAEEVDGWRPPRELQPDTPEGKETRRVLKTHAPVANVPWVQDAADVKEGIVTVPKGAKVIIVTRNPLDMACSLYQHLLDGPVYEYEGTWENFIERHYLTGNVEHGCFWEWHKGWNDTYQKYKGEGQDFNGRVLWISYEDMIEDLRAVVKQVGNFILSEPPSDELVDAVVSCSTFKAMKANFKRLEEKYAAEGRHQMIKKNHIRKGTSGGWKAKFTEEEKKKVLAHHEERCSTLGIDPKIWKI